MKSYRQVVTSLSFFGFMVNLEQSGSRIPDAWSVLLTFTLTVTFYLTTTENRTRKSLTQLSYYCTKGKGTSKGTKRTPKKPTQIRFDVFDAPILQKIFGLAVTDIRKINT